MSKNTLDEDLLVFRGIGVDTYNDIANSEEFQDLGYISTSPDSEMASLFPSKQLRIDLGIVQTRVIQIKIPKGTHVAFLQQEYEVILPRGSKFKVIKSEEGLTLELL